MSKSRRQFLALTSLGVLGAAATYSSRAQNPSDLPPGAPPAFGTAPAVGPEVSSSTFAEAEKLVQVEMSANERAVAAGSWRKMMAPLYERRTGPHKVALEPGLAPATRWDPMLPGLSAKMGPQRDRFIRSNIDPGVLPERDEDIAFAPMTKLSRWIEQRKLSSERLTRIYLKRLEQFDPKLHCVITLTRELALAQAKQADHIWCGTFPRSRARQGCRGRQTTARRRSSARRQVEPGCAGAQRYLVRRSDDESVAAGGSIIRI